MTRSELSGDAVVEFRKRDEPTIHRQIVLRIRTSHPEPTVHVDEQPRRVVFGHGPVEANWSPEHKRETRALALGRGCGGGQPESRPDDRFEVRGEEVLTGCRRDADVPERPRTDPDVDASGVPEELDTQRHRADATDGDPEAHTIARVWPLGRQRSNQHRGEQDEDRYETGHGGCPDGLIDRADTLNVQRRSNRRRSIERPGQRVHGRTALCVAVLTGLLAGCDPPDRPATLALESPEGLFAWLQPDSARSVDLHPGVVYRYLWSPRGPWAVHTVQASVSGRCDLSFEVLRAEGREDGGGGRQTVSAMAAGSEHPVLAAINADFFTPDGHAVGAEVIDGRVTAVADRPTFAWKPEEEPWLGMARQIEGGLRLGWVVPLQSGDGGTEAVGGFPDLIDRGRRIGDLEVGARPSFAAGRHPRSAVGYDSSSGEIWFVLVDGRQPPHSAGMTLPELAELFEAIGTDEALNLDGGGSSALVLDGAPINRPSDATGERAVVNALALITSPERCRGP